MRSLLLLVVLVVAQDDHMTEAQTATPVAPQVGADTTSGTTPSGSGRVRGLAGLIDQIMNQAKDLVDKVQAEFSNIAGIVASAGNMLNKLMDTVKDTIQSVENAIDGNQFWGNLTQAIDTCQDVKKDDIQFLQDNCFGNKTENNDCKQGIKNLTETYPLCPISQMVNTTVQFAENSAQFAKHIPVQITVSGSSRHNTALIASIMSFAVGVTSWTDTHSAKLVSAVENNVDNMKDTVDTVFIGVKKDTVDTVFIGVLQVMQSMENEAKQRISQTKDEDFKNSLKAAAQALLPDRQPEFDGVTPSISLLSESSDPNGNNGAAVHFSLFLFGSLFCLM